jgi:ferredoxin
MFDLTAYEPVKKIVRSKYYPLSFQVFGLIVFAFLTADAFFGVQNPALNIATNILWVWWWLFLLISILFLGRFWCSACPFGAEGDIVQRFFKGQRKWPSFLRNLWLVNIFFIIFIWFDDVMGIANNPFQTGVFLAVIFLSALLIGLVFERRSFCRYVCPLNGFIGFNSMSSFFQLRSKNKEVCLNHKEKQCINGSAVNKPCPMFEYVGGMNDNLFCIQCMECVKGCPKNNVGFGFRSFASDLYSNSRKTMEFASSVLIIIALSTLVLFFFRFQLPLPHILGLSVLLVFSIAFMFGLFSFFVILVSRIEKKEFKKTFTSYAFALIPLGLLTQIGEASSYALDKVSFLGVGREQRVVLEVFLVFIGFIASVFVSYKIYEKENEKIESLVLIGLFLFTVASMVLYSLFQ